jgi:hypothetical protein
LNIEGATDQENCSRAKYKILHRIAVAFLIFNNNIPLGWLSTASSTAHFDYSYGNIEGL